MNDPIMAKVDRTRSLRRILATSLRLQVRSGGIYKAGQGDIPPGVPQPPLDGEREEKRHARDTAGDDKERLGFACADVRNVGNLALLRDVFWSTHGEPRDEHGPQ